ncbi:MAG: hypothetical protein Q7J27_09700 [Syntrophales bacterium]|nr:hypothetical protein [Syntrophales bacterium]
MGIRTIIPKLTDGFQAKLDRFRCLPVIFQFKFPYNPQFVVKPFSIYTHLNLPAASCGKWLDVQFKKSAVKYKSFIITKNLFDIAIQRHYIIVDLR